ncbi:4576_t:CDS:2 [Funneliformis geosporum]|nr:4576_t:CDS:2 [Funneliformis geosporum]
MTLTMSFTTFTSSNLIVIIQLFIITYVARYYYKYFTRQSPLPGPFPLPLVGNLFQIGLNPAKYAIDHHHEFGKMFEIWVGNNRFIFLSHHSLTEKIYISNINNKFFKRIQVPYLEKIGLQHGLIFNNDYQIWKRNRKFVVYSLMSPRFLRQFTWLTQSYFNENESFWDKKEYHIDLAKWIKHFTTDITLRTITRRPSYCLNTFLFGENHTDPINSEEIKKSVKFSHAVQTFFKGVIFEFFVPNVLKHYFPGFYDMNKNFIKNTDWLNETISDIIKKRRMEIENDDEVGSDLIDVLLTLNTPRDLNGYNENEKPMSDQEVRATIMEVSIAGVDTTANTFCFLVWQLSHHPKVVARFREEMKEILGYDTTRQITYEDLEKFKYLDAIIKESQRTISLVPFSSRTSTGNDVIGGKWSGHEIVKNSFIPFGGGIRICPGRNMALVELKTLLILLYRKYDIELVDKVSKKPKTIFVGTNSCTDLKVIVRPRNYNNV